MKKNRSPVAVISALGVCLLVAVAASAAIGRYPISLSQIGGILASKVFDIEPFWPPVAESLLLNSRLPRIVLACLVGACLSGAGASYQGVFQNPMAAPDLLGASSGAAFGAALAIVFDLGKTMLIVFAFAFSLLTVCLVIFVGNRAKGKRVVGLILAGIMVGSLVTSATSFLKLVADPTDQLPAITYWMMGSLNGTEPSDVLLAFVPMLIGLVPLFLLRWRMNLLTLGDDEARSMGVNVGRLRTAVIVSSTLITAASVCVSGVIGWIGLVVPHLCRRIVGNNFKYLLPVSILLGALFMLLVDNISRNLFSTEIPLGILTSFIGAPFFLYLITKGGERH